MDKRLRLIQHLYGEILSADELECILEDEQTKAEYLALGETKRMLERLRPVTKPDVRVVDRIARMASRRPRRKVRRIATYAAAMAAAVTISVIVLKVLHESEQQQQLTDSAIQEDLSWDEASSLIDIHSRISALSARSDVALWDDKDVLSLDSLSAASTRDGLETASSR